MRYILTGFTHDMGYRVFAFECIEEDRARTQYHVRADLALIHKYGIRVQELPLLCRKMLERREEGVEQVRTLTYSEAEMRLNADESASVAALAAQRKKAPRRPPSENLGSAWRGPRTV
jgi:hypothetical protein